MACIRSKNTKPERLIRSLLHRLGYRFTVNGPRNRRLPGKPDIVLPKHRAIVFVHGCFWHGHEGCRHFRIPATRTAWWKAKIEGNRKRDAASIVALEAAGWRVIVLWSCEFDTITKRQALVESLPEMIEGAAATEPERLAAEDAAAYGASHQPSPIRARQNRKGRHR